jgi:hypothetical protein
MATSARQPAGRQQWERPGLLAAPSWLLSLLLHAMLLAGIAWWIQDPKPVGPAGEDDRVVGLYSAASHARPALAEPADATDDSPEFTADLTEPAGQPSPSVRQVDQFPPVPLELPERRSPKVGPAVAVPARGGLDARDLLRPGKAAAGGAAAPGVARFFGNKATGRRFVYLLDASGSMYEHGAIAVAKAELLASLSQLTEEQEFQILFYNEIVVPMSAADQRTSMFRANEVNLNRANQFVKSINPDLGTRHLPALEEALKYHADALFFLTDAGEPPLHQRDLDQLKKFNKQRIPIYATEFGKGPALRSETFWMKSLSVQSGGSYTYRDITSFQRTR